LINYTKKTPQRKNTIPEISTAPKAASQPYCGATVKAKKAFKPMPEAKAKGKLVTRPIKIVVTPAATMVAVTRARLIHTGGTQQIWVNENNISHGHEGSNAGYNFSSHSGVMFFQLKKFFHYSNLLYLLSAKLLGISERALHFSPPNQLDTFTTASADQLFRKSTFPK
jgi:hypothetical protein